MAHILEYFLDITVDRRSLPNYLNHMCMGPPGIAGVIIHCLGTSDIEWKQKLKQFRINRLGRHPLLFTHKEFVGYMKYLATIWAVGLRRNVTDITPEQSALLSDATSIATALTVANIVVSPLGITLNLIR
jgi:hypothetical protein